jgi:hypothetical protein
MSTTEQITAQITKAVEGLRAGEGGSFAASYVNENQVPVLRRVWIEAEEVDVIGTRALSDGIAA